MAKTISGTWVFNKTLTQPDFVSTSEMYPLRFTSCDTQCKFFILRWSVNREAISDIEYIRAIVPEGESEYIRVYSYYKTNVYGVGWANEAYRTIIFDGTQTVSKEFYDWFVSNAQPALSGTWVFNENLTDVNFGIQAVSFSMNIFNTSYVAMEYDLDDSNGKFGILQYLTSNGVTSAYYFNDTGWSASNVYHRLITFDDTQTVSKDFYDWFIANAKPMMADLTGTTWYVPSGWGVIAHYGQFALEFVFDCRYYAEPHECTSLNVGYYYSGGITPKEDNLFFVRASSTNPHISIDPLYDFTITFTGGTDVANSRLIFWLIVNGTQLKVTDLTDTTWYLAKGWTCSADYGLFDVTGNVVAEYPAGVISGHPNGVTHEFVFYDLYVGSSFRGTNDYRANIVNCTTGVSNRNFTNEANVTLTFNGGTDVTNPELIAWLSKYGELQTSEKTPTVTFDLSTLGLEAGTHEITVRAKASGYADSAKSNAVNYVIKGETCELSGTWVFNESISIAGIGGSWNAINFTSNGVSYIAISDRRNMSAASHDAIIRYFTSSSNYVEACNLASDAGWTDEAYRVINFGPTPQNVSKEFYEWFTANAVEEIMFFVDGGLTVRGIRGMKWYQWVVSVYNTVGYGLKWGDGVVGRPQLAYIVDVSTGIPIVSEDGERVTGDMEIIEGHSYGYFGSGGSN